MNNITFVSRILNLPPEVRSIILAYSGLPLMHHYLLQAKVTEDMLPTLIANQGWKDVLLTSPGWQQDKITTIYKPEKRYTRKRKRNWSI